MNLSPFIELSKCRGIDNVSDPARIPVGGKGDYYLSEGRNVDIDDQFMIHRMTGPSVLAYPGNIHSLWSGESACLFMQSGSLRQLDTGFSALTLLSNLETLAPMQYVEAAGTVYFTNNSVIGSVRTGTATLFPVPAGLFKAVMPAGHLIEIYHHRLYVARDQVLYFSDAAAPQQRDLRSGSRPFPSRLTMVQAVEDGLYISDQERIYFMAGGDPLDDMILIPKSDYPVMEGGFRKVLGENIGEGELSGTVIVMATSEGFCIGGNAGEFKNVTGDHYHCPALQQATSLFRGQTGNNQFIVLGNLSSNPGQLSFDLPNLTVSLTGH